MRLRLKHFNYMNFACYCSLLIIALPVVDFYCKWYITIVPVLILILGALYKKKKLAVQFTVVLLIGLCITLFQSWCVYRNVFFNRTLNGIISWTPCLIALYIGYCNDNKFANSYLNTAIGLLSITSITTIFGLTKYPNASRELASGTEIYDTLKYLKMNIGGYEFIYSLLILIPVIIWLIWTSEKKRKIVYICVLVLFYLCIFKSQYTIAIVFSIIAATIPFLLKKRNMFLLVIVGLCGVYLSVNTSLLGKLFHFLSEKMPHEYVADRLLQVAQLLDGVTVHTNTTTVRLDLYHLCIERFSHSPIFGNNIIVFSTYNISGHTAIMDIMAASGLLGLAIVVILFGLLYKNVFVAIHQLSEYTLSALLMFVIVSVFNVTTHYMIINLSLFVIPMCTEVIAKSIKTESNAFNMK